MILFYIAISHDYVREKLTKVRAQKKVLVAELRSLRDLGIYEGRITIDHAPPASTRQHASTKEQASDISDDMDLIGSEADLNAFKQRRPVVPKEKYMTNRKRDSSRAPAEKGINFSVLQVPLF